EETVTRSQVGSLIRFGQLFKTLTQALKPTVSGSRARKSMYCWRTKNGVSSIGFEVGCAVSLSLMVTVTVVGPLKPAPTGLLSVMVKVSSGSTNLSSVMKTVIVFVASPGAKRKTPAAVE